ncbi:hypothetical protein [Pararhizobium antarcticum]|uniref:hypothetical protein n=1 Tax=Pararhizobium antarcticum TaxID=1798805 RepID=UPI001114E3A6|nr:hypothetical protein [Pararhizobium antarcticum]
MTDMKVKSCRAPYRCGTVNVVTESGNHCRLPLPLTDAQTQASKVAFTVDSGRKKHNEFGASPQPLKMAVRIQAPQPAGLNNKFKTIDGKRGGLVIPPPVVFVLQPLP